MPYIGNIESYRLVTYGFEENVINYITAPVPITKEITMQVSSIPPNQEAVTEAATRWLLRVLDDPNMCLSMLSSEIKGYLYIDGTPRTILYGSWQITSDSIYLPRAGGTVEPLSKLAILSAIASMTKASSNPVIVEKITQKLAILLNEATKSIYNSVITGTHRPSRLAIDLEGLQIAAELNNTWLLTNGAPAMVDDKWITMDF